MISTTTTISSSFPMSSSQCRNLPTSFSWDLSLFLHNLFSDPLQYDSSNLDVFLNHICNLAFIPNALSRLVAVSFDTNAHMIIREKHPRIPSVIVDLDPLKVRYSNWNVFGKCEIRKQWKTTTRTKGTLSISWFFSFVPESVHRWLFVESIFGQCNKLAHLLKNHHTESFRIRSGLRTSNRCTSRTGIRTTLCCLTQLETSRWIPYENIYSRVSSAPWV